MVKIENMQMKSNYIWWLYAGSFTLGGGGYYHHSPLPTVLNFLVGSDKVGV